MSETRVRLPDGSYVKVPTDDPQVAAVAARKHWETKNPSTYKKAQNWLDGTFGAWADAAVDNLTPNWGDEFRGVRHAIKEGLEGRNPVEGFREGQRGFKPAQERFSRDHAYQAANAKLTGFAGGIVLPAGRAFKGASMAQKGLQGAKVGGAYGLVAGAGEGEGLDLPRRATNAATSAAYGAGTGFATPYVARGAVGAGRWSRQYIPGADRAARLAEAAPRAIASALSRRRPTAPVPSAATQQGNRLAGRRMSEGNIANGPALNGPPASPQGIQDEVARRQGIGVPAMIGDTTEALRRTTGWATRGIGPGQSMVRQRLAERKATEGDRIRQHVTDTMPTTPDPIAFVENQQRAAKAAAGPLYEQAYQQPMYRTEPIQAIERTPAFRGALPQAYDNIRNQIDPASGLPKSPSQMGFRDMPNVDPNGLPPSVPHFQHPDGNGYVAVDDGLSFEGYDQVTRAMKAAGEDAARVNPLTGRVNHTTNSVHVNARADDLRGHLRSQNGPYDQAVGRYGDDMTYTNAFEQGGNVGNVTGHEVNAQARALPEQAHEAWATGAGTAMADRASQYSAAFPNGDTATAVRKMLGDDIKQQAIGEIGGNTGGVRQLQDRLEAEHQANLTWREANGNSRTADFQAIDADTNGELGIPTSKAGMLSAFVDFVGSHASTRYRQEVKRRVGDILTSSSPRSVQEAMEAIEQQAQRDRRFADLLHTAGIATSAAYGANVAPSDPIPEP